MESGKGGGEYWRYLLGNGVDLLSVGGTLGQPVLLGMVL